ncbi:pentatricopeptide repeat-containing protein At2g35030, mitochondrial-like [Coffea eugenioides]|uniref:pentatricopeptide repeat-containing protein At2g35030, mitochondrial-like n=1 Tax=Coffea eugenioides TaxID=49369 RepID=UPI000F611B83|nr:pentatricopeptide repeat-containing protein At2g35030, mitochondrial-like [Coffea eugenioides]
MMKARLHSVAGHLNRRGQQDVFQLNLKITQLAKRGDIDEAFRVFNAIAHPNAVTYNSMISAYAKNGRISEACALFNRMPFQNLISWNTMMSGYLYNDYFKEAADLFDKMRRRDSFTYSLMITCYARSGFVEKARRIFDSMPDKSCAACWNALVTGYVKNGMLSDGRKLFNEMPVRNLVSWNTMLSGYTRSGQMRLAAKFFEEMEEKDWISWNLVLEGYTQAGDLNAAREFFERIPNPSVVSWATMLSGFARHGHLSEAEGFFNNMTERNVVAWNVMLAAYIQNCKVDKAVELFNEMPEKDAISWTTIISGHVRIGQLEEAKKLLDRMPYENVGSQTAMILGFIQNNRMDDASQIFDRMRKRDTVCWNTMIAGYAQHGRMDEAFDLFQNMAPKKIDTWNTMIAGYAQVGKMERALELFEQIEEKNVVSWNSIISGYAQNGLYMDALKSILLMIRDGKKPDQSTFASGLRVCASLAAEQFGQQLHHIVVKNGYMKDMVVSNALITMYAKCGSILSARDVFSDVDNLDVVSWNSLIAGYALNGYGIEAFKLFQEMEGYAVIPDQVTFVGVLSACNHAGLVSAGLTLFNCMTQKYGIEPLAEHYTCMVDMLGRAGRLEEAFELVRKMKVQATAGIWGALLGACRLHKNVMLADFAARKLFEIEPHKTSSLVLLSNIYAQSGRWDEVDRVRNFLNQNGIEKEPGCSWIEDQRQILVFQSDDYSWPKTAEIYRALQILTTQIMELSCLNGIECALLDIELPDGFNNGAKLLVNLDLNICLHKEVRYHSDEMGGKTSVRSSGELMLAIGQILLFEFFNDYLTETQQKFDDLSMVFIINWYCSSICISLLALGSDHRTPDHLESRSHDAILCQEALDW